METPKYLVRLDDASEYMSIDKWEAFFSVFDKYGVKPIVAVIPHVEDEKLIADHPKIEDFWERVAVWQKKGYAIALHGFNHVYTTKKSGIIKKNLFSEFAGVPYRIQANKIERGLKVFREHDVKAKLFVAPAHSFDDNTIKALINKSDIRIISDGFAYHTFSYKGMYWIPQQLSHPEEKKEGVWTICYHPEMAEQWQLEALQEFIEKNKDLFINPLDVPLNETFADEDIFFFKSQQRAFQIKNVKNKSKQMKESIRRIIPMSLLYQIKRTPVRLWRKILYKLSPILPDKIYLRSLFFNRVGYKLNLDNPQTFNEKLQWLKVYGHKDKYTMLADKYKVKQYVAEAIGEYYIVPCLGVWSDANDIDFESLPDRFVLKCNHNSGGGMCVCRDKTKIDFDKVRKELNDCIKQGYYWKGHDKQYRDIEKRIIADTFLDDHREGELQDYKFWCFNGEPTYMYITNKGEKIYENFYDMDFNPVNINHGFPRMMPEYKKPDEFEEMKTLAKKLSHDIPFVRIDFFDVDHHVYFGEFTFFDWGGLRPFVNYEMDLELGKLIRLPVK